MHFRMIGPDDIAEIYVREITEGIGSTGIKAGIIKTATGGVPGWTDGRRSPSRKRRHFARAARAQKATGAPILCHNNEMSPFGRETLDIFEAEGVDFNSVLIGHACGVGDMRYYFDILDRGAWLGFDRFGLDRSLLTGCGWRRCLVCWPSASTVSCFRTTRCHAGLGVKPPPSRE